MGIQVEKDEKSLLAVIYGSGDLEFGLVKALKRQHLRVIHLESETDALPILEKPAYIFFFAENTVPLANLKIQLREALISASRCGARLVVTLGDLDETYEQALEETLEKNSWPVTRAETRGKMDGPSGPLTEIAVGKLVRLAFSAHTMAKQILIGKEETAAKKPTSAQRVLSTQDVFNKLNQFKKKKVFRPKQAIGRLALFASLILISASLFLLILPTLRGIYNLNTAKNDLLSGQFDDAQIAATNAKADFTSAKQIALLIPMEGYFDSLVLGQTAADLFGRVAKIGPQTLLFAKSLSGGDSPNLGPVLAQIHAQVGPIKDDLGLIEAQTKNFPFFKKYLAEVPRARATLDQADNFLSVWPEILPPNKKQTFLLIFQNSAELRPTGGFIGSYGLVNFDSGKLTSWQIYDIYSADGQLRGQISPPDELLHFLNQPSWFMRDGNWAPDFPLTAKRLLWFLEKETGQQADGVIAINLGAAKKILEATGPVAVPDLSQTVSSNDFFEKAEYSSEINFFAGSTQKKDFLGAVARGMLAKVTAGASTNWPAMGQALFLALEQKDIMIYFNAPGAEKIAVDSGWGGAITNNACGDGVTNCLMVVEANLGLNKANYFIKREIGVASIIDQAGNIDTTITVRYHNASPSETWPGGKYKNYLRFLVPKGATVTGFDINNGRKPVISPILSAIELEKLTTNQFFVFQTQEAASFSSFGTLVEVPLKSDLTVVFQYRLPNKLVFAPQTNYTFNFLKQPGTGPDPLDVTLEYPGFLAPENSDSLGNLLPLVFPQKLIYNSDTTTDRKFEVKFVNKI